MQDKKGHYYTQWGTAILANSLVFTYGLQAGWVSPITRLLQSEDSPTGEPLTNVHISWIASVFCLIASLSTSFYSYVADHFGRKNALIAIAVPQALCWTIKLFVPSITGLVIARILCGIASGGVFNVIPMYTKEIAQEEIRGVLGTLLMLMQNVGIFTMYAMGSYMDYYTVLWIVLGLPLAHVLLFMRAPESPPYLVKVGKIEEATSTLAFLRGLNINDKAIINEVQVLRNENNQHEDMNDISYSSIFKDKAYRKAFFIVIAIITAACCNGAFTILTYAIGIMESAGVAFSPELQTLSFPAVMIVGSFTSMACVERLGRRLLYISGLTLTTIALTTLATSVLLQSQGGAPPTWIPAVTIVGSVFAYAAGVAPMPYIIMSEIFNFQGHLLRHLLRVPLVRKVLVESYHGRQLCWWSGLLPDAIKPLTAILRYQPTSLGALQSTETIQVNTTLAVTNPRSD